MYDLSSFHIRTHKDTQLHFFFVSADKKNTARVKARNNVIRKITHAIVRVHDQRTQSKW